MRLGIFGGSFDPPHVGHLLVAQDAIDALGLDLLLVVPAATQPLKRTHRTDAVHRLAMVRHAFAGVPRVMVDPVEIDRGGLSFMVDTVEHVLGRWPGASLSLLIGDDVVATLPRWRDSERLLSMVGLVVLHRVTDAATDPASREQHGSGAAPLEQVGIASPRAATVRHLATRRVDVSSTEIRARVRDGRSIRGFVTDAVADYIASAALYLSEPDPAAPARA
jgi:nicotinate-nucleotide adenylyltransferase